jgi:hypothetical protein
MISIRGGLKNLGWKGALAMLISLCVLSILAFTLLAH